MIYLFDSSILLHYVRQTTIMVEVERVYDPFGSDNEAWICIVSKGELRSISLQNEWGTSRRNRLERLLSDFFPADIFSEEVLDAYAEIDAFSQGKLPGKSSGVSARNMGKNDLWIAATAFVLNAKLLTTDADFEHLNGIYVDVVRF